MLAREIGDRDRESDNYLWVDKDFRKEVKKLHDEFLMITPERVLGHFDVIKHISPVNLTWVSGYGLITSNEKLDGTSLLTLGQIFSDPFGVDTVSVDHIKFLMNSVQFSVIYFEGVCEIVYYELELKWL